ncbi:MAG: M56 family metallopeptidase [Ferruginibacter sp.]
MPVYFEYAVKISLCLAIISLFYYLLLRQMTWYTWNRFFLLAFSIFSFIAPFINFNRLIVPGQIDFIPIVSFVQDLSNKIPANQIANSVGFHYWNYLAALYIFICLLLFVRLIIQLLSIQRIKVAANLTLNDKVAIYHLPKPILPFSFLNCIFINKHSYSDTELQKIIDHEVVHVRQKHTIDVLITEMICIINWFNPFAWLIKKAIRENLEFIADDAVIQRGVERKNYQYLMLKVTGMVPFSIVNSFTLTSLKSRIRMMNKSKTGRLHLLKFVLIIPLATLLLLAFTINPEVYTTAAEANKTITKTYFLSALTYSIPDKKVEAAVIKDSKKCLLKTGQPLDLGLVFNEKERLSKLLLGIGYTNIGPHAITFMIDTTLANNSFSIQVNIHLVNGNLSNNKDEFTDNTKMINAQSDPGENVISSSSDRVNQPRSLQSKDDK